MTEAKIAVNLVVSNSASAGSRYTNAGMVCAASSRGRWTAEYRGERAAATPSSRPMTSVTSTATATVVIVCMVCSHTPSSAIASRQASAVSAGRTPLTHQATVSTASATSHHGAEVSSDSRG
ncbi:hypothetical protein ACFQQB_35725 [Nonomuraea rubra]|uniref:hypothetical protein n=1 Tax=Nonomuraea rubra TaxID=46180 RepID=UPI00361308B7